MKNLVETNIYSIIPRAKKSASVKARLTAEKWTAVYHYSTHRKINSKRGLWTGSESKNHKWNNAL
jgi:hypothetical protein